MQYPSCFISICEGTRHYYGNQTTTNVKNLKNHTKKIGSTCGSMAVSIISYATYSTLPLYGQCIFITRPINIYCGTNHHYGNQTTMNSTPYMTLMLNMKRCLLFHAVLVVSYGLYPIFDPTIARSMHFHVRIINIYCDINHGYGNRTTQYTTLTLILWGVYNSIIVSTASDWSYHIPDPIIERPMHSHTLLISIYCGTNCHHGNHTTTNSKQYTTLMLNMKECLRLFRRFGRT